jgi:dihydrofolate reductase
MDGEKSIIVAYDRNRVIGRNNALPWTGQLPADMERFTRETMGKSVIMGRSTFESIPAAFRPLRGRQNIVLSRKALSIEGVLVTHSLEDAYQQAEAPIMVIGGASIYEQALPTVDTVYATEIFAKTPNGDSFFPELPSNEWSVDLGSQEFHLADERNKYNYTFVTFIRKYPTQR